MYNTLYIYTGGVSYQSRTDKAAMRAIMKKSVAHAEKVAQLIENL